MKLQITRLAQVEEEMQRFRHQLSCSFQVHGVWGKEEQYYTCLEINPIGITEKQDQIY